MYVWADTAVDRTIFGWDVPITWIGMFDGMMTIVGRDNRDQHLETIGAA